jgi:hypothetical protein
MVQLVVHTVIISRVGRIIPLVDGLGVNRNNIYVSKESGGEDVVDMCRERTLMGG